MAQSFTALGKGNGFPFCLNARNLPSNGIIQNAPDLEQTMSAYWNFDSGSWGGASFDPTNEPSDLICNNNDNLGDDYNNISSNEYYVVSNSFPAKVDDNGNVEYVHGISFQYSKTVFLNPGVRNLTVRYQSTYYIDNAYPYVCEPIYYYPYGGGNPYLIGYTATERIKTVSNVAISGIPFLKVVTKFFSSSDYSANPSCPLVGTYPSEPTTIPTLNLHTY